jgi:Cysteine rich repeat
MNKLALLMLCSVASGTPFAHADEAAAMAILRNGCTEDAQRLCAGVQPGGGRVLACLKEHKDALSDKCKQAAQQAQAASGGAPAPTPPSAPTPSAPTPSAPTPSAPTPSAPPPTATAAPPAASSKPSTQSSAPAGGHTLASDAASPSYLRMKKAQIMVMISTAPNAQQQPGVEMLIPTTWEFKGEAQVGTGKSGCFCDAFPIVWEAKSADGSTKFMGIPNYSWQYSDDPQEMQKLNNPNRRPIGGNGKVCPVSKPLTAEQFFRENLMGLLPSGTTVVSIDPYPELNEMARVQMGLGPNDSGNGSIRTDAIRARVESQKDGKPIEAWLTAAVVMRTFRVGRGFLYDLHAIDLMSFTAPKGKLVGNEKLLRVMMSSIRITPEYSAFSNKYIASLYQAQAQKEAVMDQINAKLQQQIMQTYMDINANMMRGSEQSFLAADQNIRGVQTFRDPSTGRTMELSNLYDHAWLNGSNEYVMSDSPNFNPNTQLSGSWNQLQAVRPSP